MQKEIHEKDAQLNMSQERISQLKQEIKFIETEYIQSRAIIMRFQEEHKLKKAVLSKKSKKALTMDE